MQERENIVPTVQDIYQAANTLNETALQSFLDRGFLLNPTNDQGQSALFLLAHESRHADGTNDQTKLQAVKLLMAFLTVSSLKILLQGITTRIMLREI